jgi:hypothetical protein
VDGTSVTVEVDKLSIKVAGVEYAIELGAFILIAAPASDLIASVASIRVAEGQDEKKERIERRIVTCTLVGFLKNGQHFERGIERYPTVGSEAYLMTEAALSAMFSTTVNGVPIGERCQRGAGTRLG